MTGGSVLARRRISPRACLGLHAASALGGAGLGYAARALGAGALVWLGLAVAPLLIVAALCWLHRAATEYRVFEDSLEAEYGIVARRIENIQLFRVRDIGMKQTLAGRILRYGDVIILSTDESAPRLTLRGLDDPRALYEQLRSLVARSQATRRTMIVEAEDTQITDET